MDVSIPLQPPKLESSGNPMRGYSNQDLHTQGHSNQMYLA